MLLHDDRAVILHASSSFRSLHLNNSSAVLLSAGRLSCQEMLEHTSLNILTPSMKRCVLRIRAKSMYVARVAVQTGD
jgi:hypothetical protein